MSDKIKINKVTNTNVYVDGVSFLGRAEEITLPQVKQKMSDHKGLGLAGSLELPSGIDKLECKIKWASLYPEVLKKAANPFKPVPLQVRTSLETYTGQGRTAEVPVVVYLTVSCKEFPLGAYKHHDPAEFETNHSCSYVKLVVDGEEILEIDVFANIYKVDGMDLLETYRKNIGG